MRRIDMRTNPMVAALLMSILTTAGCGSSDGSAAPGGGGSSSSVATSPTSPAPNALTIEGTVRRGVEHGCLVLRAKGVVYLLLGDAVPPPSPRQRVRIVGVLKPDVATSCMQGIPLEMRRIEPLDD